MTQLGGVPEATIEPRPEGRVPVDAGWWILNLAEMAFETMPGGGTWTVFEAEGHGSPTLGVGLHVLWPGDTPGKYHAEGDQEGFLVLRGECVAIVEGQERRMGPWDYFHCPPGTAHITVGAGDGPCALLMLGTRVDGSTMYLPDAAAARYGAAVLEATPDSAVAYAGGPAREPARSPWPLDADPGRRTG